MPIWEQVSATVDSSLDNSSDDVIIRKSLNFLETQCVFPEKFIWKILTNLEEVVEEFRKINGEGSMWWSRYSREHLP